jgi:hypothetical protein
MNSEISIVSQLRAEEKTVQEKLEKLRQPIAQLESDLQHIRGVIEFYQRSASKNPTSKIAEEVKDFTDAIVAASSLRLKGLSHAEAAIAIAKSNGGVVRTQEAKHLMIKAGIMSRTKNSTNMAHNAIQRSGMFERVTAGVYRLKEAGSLFNDSTIRSLTDYPGNGLPVGGQAGSVGERG